MADNDQIDMSKLTQRELLILLHHRVTNIENRIVKSDDLEIRVNTLETRNKIISALFAGGSVLITLIINAFDKMR